MLGSLKFLVPILFLGAHRLLASDPGEPPPTQPHTIRAHGSCPIELSWAEGNNDFYDHLSVEEFMARCRQVGMVSCADLRSSGMLQLFGMPSSRDYPVPENVLEIGGGFGRIMHYLRTSTYIPDVYVVETNKNYFQYLQMRLGRMQTSLQSRKTQLPNPDQNVQVIQRSIVQYHPPVKIRLALWMWSGFLELPPLMKVEALQNLRRILADDGTLVIDLTVGKYVPTPTIDVRGDLVTLAMQRSPGAPRLRLHVMNPDTLRAIAEKEGFIFDGCLPYFTEPEETDHIRERRLCFFRNPPLR